MRYDFDEVIGGAFAVERTDRIKSLTATALLLGSATQPRAKDGRWKPGGGGGSGGGDDSGGDSDDKKEGEVTGARPLEGDTAWRSIPSHNTRAVGEYQLLGNTINRKLRSGELTDRDRDVVRGTDDLFAKSPPIDKPIVCYRGVGDGKKIFGPVGQAGTTWSDLGYNSASTDKSAVAGYGGVETTVKIHVPAGKKVIALDGSQYGGWTQGETLLPRGTVYRMTRDEEAAGVRYIDLEVIRQPGG
jgi:hypothetical protein